MNKAFLVGVSQLGVKGTLGSSHNPQILKYFRDIGHEWVKDDETAWCAAYLNWCLQRAGLPHTGKLNARSFLKYGDETTKPILGDLAVLWRISPTSAYGHVGFYLAEQKNYIFLLGGNQSNSVTVSAFPKSQVLGYRTRQDWF